MLFRRVCLPSEFDKGTGPSFSGHARSRHEPSSSSLLRLTMWRKSRIIYGVSMKMPISDVFMCVVLGRRERLVVSRKLDTDRGA